MLVAAIATAKAQVERSTSSSPPILPQPGSWHSNGADTAAGATDASVGRSAWQVASRMGALVLGHRRFLCDDRVFEPLALSRLVCLPAAMPDMPLSVLTGSLAATLLMAQMELVAGRFVSRCRAARCARVV